MDFSEKKPINKQLVVIAVVVAAIIFLIPIGYLVQKQLQSTKVQASAPKPVLVDQGPNYIQTFPLRIIIPKIKVDSAVEYVGLTPEGEMAVPSTTQDVGWYKQGPIPGQQGSAVLSGHFDNRKGKTGVFNNLKKLKAGDKIFVTDTLGATTTFMVQKIRDLKPGYAEEVFNMPDNGIHLNLVTCGGYWDEGKQSYSKRLVVFADIMP